MILSQEQQCAVERIGQDVCVVAGPGSGKTRVLTERYAWLVESKQIDPARILAITFTEKAATEIKQRLVLRFAHDPRKQGEVERAWIYTIDAFCARLLREHAIAAGLPPDFTVLEATKAARLLRESTERALDELFQAHPVEVRRLLEALDLDTGDQNRKPDLARSLMEAYETIRVSDTSQLPAPIPPPDVTGKVEQAVTAILTDPTFGGAASESFREWATQYRALPAAVSKLHFSLPELGNAAHLTGKGGGKDAAKELKKTLFPQLLAQWLVTYNQGLLELLADAMRRLDAKFRDAKQVLGAVDFADLEERTIELLDRDPELRRLVVDKFDHVLMDELQDTNRLQWRLVNLVRRNFFAVGDINQSIYGFRHADPEVFADYRSAVVESGGVVDSLTDNHRSRPEILAAVSLALDDQPGIEYRPLQARKDRSPDSAPIVERLVGRGDDGESAESRLIALRIQQLYDPARRPYSHFAILLRTLSPSVIIGRALEDAGIPYLVSGGRTLFEARESQDVLGLLAALVNPLDEIPLVGTLRSPLVGWSDERLLREGKDGWCREFDRLFGEIRKLAGYLPPDRLISIALDECGYLQRLSARGQSNIEKLLALIRREHSQQPRPLAELLSELDAIRSSQTEAEAPPPQAANAVRIMSVHAAKGLEFPVVFLSALHRGTENSTPVILCSPQDGLGAKWRNPVNGDGLADAAHAIDPESPEGSQA